MTQVRFRAAEFIRNVLKRQNIRQVGEGKRYSKVWQRIDPERERRFGVRSDAAGNLYCMSTVFADCGRGMFSCHFYAPEPIVKVMGRKRQGKGGKRLASRIPRPEEVHAELAQLYDSRHFRGTKLRRLLDFLVEQWFVDGGVHLTVNYIGESLKDEPLTFEEHSDRWGYPKTRANLSHVRKRLQKHFETNGYRDRVIIKLNLGSYVPVIAYNSVSTAIPNLEPALERLILRMKTAVDARTLRGAWRGFTYYDQLSFRVENPRQAANVLFFPMAVAPIVPGVAMSVRSVAQTIFDWIRASGVEPWECTFAEACGAACYDHDWPKALGLFELAIANSQGRQRIFGGIRHCLLQWVARTEPSTFLTLPYAISREGMLPLEPIWRCCRLWRGSSKTPRNPS